MVMTNVDTPEGRDLSDSLAASSAGSPSAAKGGDDSPDLAQLLSAQSGGQSDSSPINDLGGNSTLDTNQILGSLVKDVLEVTLVEGGSGEQGNCFADLASCPTRSAE